MTRRRIVWAVLIAAVLILAGAWIAGSILSWPRGSAVAAPAPPGRVVQLMASDGVAIAGSYWPGARPDGPAILLLHGINNNRDRMRAQALWLNGLGYGVLAIDFRGHGESGAAPRSFGLHEARDAAAALAFLRRDAPARRVGLIGISLGGAAALLGDDGPLPVQAMVLHAVYPDLRTAIVNRIARVSGRPLAHLGEPLLSFQSWPRYGVAPSRIAPIEGLRRFRGAVLIVGGTADRDTTPADTEAMLAAAPGPRSLWLIDGADHLATSIVWNDEYRRRLRAFFAATLGAPGAAPAGP
jgi:pimeloyl-ACP methyl ester carboxylesterase